MIYLLTAIGLAPCGSSKVHIYTQTIHRTTQNKQYIEQHKNFGRVRAVCPSWRVIPWHLPYNWGKSTEKPQPGSQRIGIHTPNIKSTYITVKIHKLQYYNNNKSNIFPRYRLIGLHVPWSYWPINTDLYIYINLLYLSIYTLLSLNKGKTIPTQVWSSHMKVTRLSALRTGRLYHHGDTPVTHFS
jgi:hypothetical protein